MIERKGHFDAINTELTCRECSAGVVEQDMKMWIFALELVC